MRVGTEDGRGMSNGLAIQQMDRSSMKEQRLQHGFSLVELVVALGFGLILGLMAVPNMRAFFAKYQLMSASNQLGFDIARTRMLAVGRNCFARIKMQSATQYNRETSTDGTTWTNLGTTKLPKGVTAAPTSGEVRFDRRGFATVNNSIALSDTTQQAKTVCTTLVGQVSIAKGTSCT
jgi:Tfp pilus assembly protein FimT